MIVSGIPEKNSNHATQIIDMAFDMLATMSTVRNQVSCEAMCIRIGKFQ